MTDRGLGINLQRRTGRRRSTPTSPTSPAATFQRKYGKSQETNTPVFSPIEANTYGTSLESPSIDLTVPSPTFDITTFSPAFGSSNNDTQKQSHGRFSDDLAKRPFVSSENVRPATSGNATRPTRLQQENVKYSSDATSLRGSPVSGGQRISAEALKRPTSREVQEEASLQRAATFWAQYGTNEEAAAVKAQPTSKKSRFNLLNPMNLLARRRSSQNTNTLEDPNLNVNTMHVPAIPDNVTPSIRGHIVHDFSAPRAKRMNSDFSPRPGLSPNPNYPRRPSDLLSPQTDTSAGTPASTHSPMFKEHFQEGQRPIQPANTSYLHSQNLHLPPPGSLPTFAKHLPLNLPEDEPLSVAGEVFDNQAKDEKEETPSEPEFPPPPPPKKTPSPVPDIPPVNSLPKHMLSTSSRFSYLGQQGSLAQERLLEEKHKEHALKNPAPIRQSMMSIDMDDFDYNDMEDDDEFGTGDITIRNIDMPSSQTRNDQHTIDEEDDYGFGDDYDDDADEFGTEDIVVKDINTITSGIGQSHANKPIATDESISNLDSLSNRLHQLRVDTGGHKRQSLQALHFTPPSASFSPTAELTSQSTPRDIEGLPIGMAESKEQAYDVTSKVDGHAQSSMQPTFFEGLGIVTQQTPNAAASGLGKSENFDDLDFDDGEFDDYLAETSGQFDEEALDDAQQIKDIPAENARKYEEALRRSQPGENVKVVTEEHPQASYMCAESPDSTFKGPVPASQPGLTEDNLAAYHDALAMAANKAAADGKFNRTVSFSQVSDDETDSPFHNSIPGISSRDSRLSNHIISSAISDEDGFGFDDDMDDEAMIAAANAEALENDDDGFYGQEFGFYARAHTKDAVEFTSGGFFASRGSSGLKRSHSGKNNFQEPSLTPITERSEWSTRNSVASLPLHNGMGLPSPGIAQLLERDSPIVENEMSLETLMKLRGRAFGGSSSSINSLADRYHSQSSPLTQMSGYSAVGDSFGGKLPVPGHRSASIAESEDEDDDGKPTLTHNTPHKKLVLPTRDTSHSSTEQMQSSPMRRKGNHSRNSSGAESVSYAQDEDGRWVLERRRTGDDGELELVERDVLDGMRI